MPEVVQDPSLCPPTRRRARPPAVTPRDGELKTPHRFEHGRGLGLSSHRSAKLIQACQGTAEVAVSVVIHSARLASDNGTAVQAQDGRRCMHELEVELSD